MFKFLPSRAIARLGPALRSWRREEQRPMAQRRLQEVLWRLSAALLLGLTALALRSMVIQQHETRVAERQEALTTLQHTLRLTLQTVEDWGHWTEMYAYVEAPEPTFLDVNIRRSGLLQLEGVMLVFDRQHNLLFSADREGFNHPEHRTLVDCLRPDLPGLKGVEDSRFFLCSGPKGMVYVGSILPISDSRSEKAANGTIGFLLPLQEADSPARSTRILNQLLADLRPVPRHLTSPASPQLISLQDKLGQPLLARPDHQILQRAGGPWESAAGPLTTALAMVILGSCTALVLRMVWMLEQRRQRLAQCRLDINRRLQQRRQLAEQQRRQIEQKLSSSLTAAAVAHGRHGGPRHPATPEHHPSALSPGPAGSERIRGRGRTPIKLQNPGRSPGPSAGSPERGGPTGGKDHRNHAHAAAQCAYAPPPRESANGGGELSAVLSPTAQQPRHHPANPWTGSAHAAGRRCHSTAIGTEQSHPELH